MTAGRTIALSILVAETNSIETVLKLVLQILFLDPSSLSFSDVRAVSLLFVPPSYNSVHECITFCYA